MARLIIILDRRDVAGDVSFRVAFWAAVPAARQPFYANALAVSGVTDASAGELAAIRTGAVVERVNTARLPAGTTIPQVQAQLIAAWNDYQAEITAANPWARYGTSWDGTTWTAGGVA